MNDLLAQFIPMFVVTFGVFVLFFCLWGLVIWSRKNP
ncbi:Uncharacterised protein [Moraxella lacunata]|uniref:Uncharacterized protein n=1 Tax=Moraxella lacunata TaxID=477 RepID=A0A378TQN8_MORLA|nr:Uncharacterised protein [Moraxella lacunata]